APDPPPPLSSCLLIFNTSHLYLYYYPYSSSTHHYTHSFPTRRSSDLLGREPAQEIEGLLPAPPERAHRMLGVRAEILALVGPPVGVDREEHGLVHGQDRPEAAHERLLRVAQVTEHLRCGTVLRVRTSRMHV